MGQRLRERLATKRLLVAPGVFDLVSTRLASAQGFDALYMTGYGVVASHLGLPDVGLASSTDMAGRVSAIASMASAPLIADGDTGYGGLLNVRHTVESYEAAGAAAIQLEDQEFPKKCGHALGRRVIDTDAMIRRVEVAVEARRDPDFLIIARTDARTTLGLDEALRRGEAYIKAGADILFIESPESEDELARIGRSFDVPLVANMVEGGRTPVLSRALLEELGFRIAIYPVAGLFAAAAALRDTYRYLQDTGSTKGFGRELFAFADFNALMGWAEIADFDRRHPE
ncbi:MAG: isocitrate lyase/PEP mutase family protein [Stellaceae bacterium]